MTDFGPASLTASNRRRLSWLCLGYALVMLYSSTIIGPSGIHFVVRDPADAFRQFLDTRFVAHGSDQRADWIGNLLMLVPFGFLVAGAFWPRRRAFQLPAMVGAAVICTTIILGIKYLQLFFPPRTVTLNYIVAQGLGATVGVAAFAVWHDCIRRSVNRRNSIAALVLFLRIYCGALLIFVLMPLDFALNSTDLWIQAQRLPDSILALPGGDRPMPVRIMLIAIAVLAFVPVGMLLVFVRTGVYRVRRGLVAVTAMGLALTTGLFLLSALVLGATPIMASILYRTLGIMSGAMSLRWLARQDPVRLRTILRRLVPWMIVPYLLALLVANQLLSWHWLTPREAVAQAYPLGLIPLFDYYIVSKAAAAKNIVAHALIYMPVGVGLWLREENRSKGPAFFLAAALSFGVELARYLRPGLEGDINAIVVAGLSAMLAIRLMPVVWSMLTTLTAQSAATPIRHWNLPTGRPLGEIEHF